MIDDIAHILLENIVQPWTRKQTLHVVHDVQYNYSHF